MFQTMTDRFEAERQFVSTLILTGGAAWKDVFPDFKADDIENLEYRKILGAILEFIDQHQPFDSVALAKSLPNDFSVILVEMMKDGFTLDGRMGEISQALMVHKLSPITVRPMNIPTDNSQTEIAQKVLDEINVFSFGGEFYVYSSSGVWRRDNTRLIERTIKRILGRRANRGSIESIRFLVALECHRGENQINTRPHLINFQNGMFDLGTLELRPHAEWYFSTIQLQMRYDAAAQCPRWNQFLDEIFCGDESLAMLLQEIFGYVLTPSTAHQKMFWLIGEGANGKGVTLQIMESLIDKANRTSLDLKNLSSPFVRAAIYNKLVSVHGDCPPKFFGNEYLLKQFIGGDSVDAQEKYGPQFEFTPFCRFIFAMNSLPETKDKSHGFFRRVVIVPFRRIFKESEQDKHLVEKLRGELPGIFNWSLEGLKRLRANGGFTHSSLSADALTSYKSEHNSVGSFIESCCVINPDAKCKATDLWTAYGVYCAEDGVEPLDRREFAMQLRRNYPLTVKTHRWGSDDSPQRTYFGIGILA